MKGGIHKVQKFYGPFESCKRHGRFKNPVNWRAITDHVVVFREHLGKNSREDYNFDSYNVIITETKS